MRSKIDLVWDKLRPIIKSELTNTEITLDENIYRLDNFGAIIRKEDFGKKTEFGWNIDHTFPISKGGDNNIKNLEAMHWRNNEAKGEDFPTFSYTTSAKKPIIRIENETKLRVRPTLSKSTLTELKAIYPKIQVVEFAQ